MIWLAVTVGVALGALALGYVLGRDTGYEYGYNAAEKYFKNNNQSKENQS